MLHGGATGDLFGLGRKEKGPELASAAGGFTLVALGVIA